VYVVDEHDRIVELADIPKPATGDPSPIVIADEQAVVLTYLPQERDSSEGPSTFCFVRFNRVWTHSFGAPNDETLEGHPLWDRGLGFYGVFRVDESSLVRRLARMNSVHKQHDYSTFDGLSHYIFTFHDSAFECAARSYEVVIERVAWDERYGKALELLHRVPPSDPSKFVKNDPASRLYRLLPEGFRYFLDAFRF
jgi:hypothetical protein